LLFDKKVGEEKMNDMKKYLAELLGTFALIFIGCGSAVIAGQFVGFLGISFAFGLTVLAMVYAIGDISGCHINPAITIAMFVAKKIKMKDTVAYIIAQCMGAIIAAGILLLIASGNADYSLAINGLGQNGYGLFSPSEYSLLSCFIAEFVLTFLFIFVVFGSTSKQDGKRFAGISIGLTLTFVHIVGIPITGTSVNPARSLGPAFFAGGEALAQLWLFWAAPILAGILVAIIWKYIFEEK
jgi:aquaporin Z